jgi:hypothetical protein
MMKGHTRSITLDLRLHNHMLGIIWAAFRRESWARE